MPKIRLLRPQNASFGTNTFIIQIVGRVRPQIEQTPIEPNRKIGNSGPFAEGKPRKKATASQEISDVSPDLLSLVSRKVFSIPTVITGSLEGLYVQVI
jgi:hypothetical protein